MHRKEFNEGFSSALENGSDYRNPYPPGTSKYDEFELGWSQACRMYPGSIERADKKREIQEAGDRELESQRRQRVRDAYNRAKGGE